MALTSTQAKAAKQILMDALRKKMQSYKPEPSAMLFHTRLLGKDRLALYSFIHSLNTNFGTSIFEPVALALAKDRFKHSAAQKIAGDTISEIAQIEIQRIMDDLTAANIKPDKTEEIETLRQVCQKGKMRGEANQSRYIP